MKRGARNSIIGLMIVGLFLGAGGTGAVRRMRLRWRAWLQPPTADQIQRAQPDPTPLPQSTLPRERVRGKMWLADPPRPVSVAVVLATIIAGALLTMYFTGRPGSPSGSQ
jgi:hypothetical protein